jgi:hypothetical protein
VGSIPASRTIRYRSKEKARSADLAFSFAVFLSAPHRHIASENKKANPTVGFRAVAVATV